MTTPTEEAAAQLADMLAKRATIKAEEPPRREGPGVYPDLTPAQYHADPAPRPSLSASVATCLINKTPFHAWMKHSRLTAEWREEDEKAEAESNSASRFGSVAHELLLGRGQGIHVIRETEDANGKVIAYPTHYLHKETKRIRDEAIARGETPCLAHELARAEDVVNQVRDGLRAIPECEEAFGPEALGSEVTVIAHEPDYDVFTRCLVDSWGPRNWELWDLKTTRDLSDEALARKIDKENMDLRVAFYERCITRAMPVIAGKLRYRFVFVEALPPHMVRVVEIPKAGVDRGHEKVAWALSLWQRCTSTNKWPGYAKQIELFGLPIFAARRWDDRLNPDNIAFDPDVWAAIAADGFRRADPTPLPSRPDNSLTVIAP